MNLLAYTTPIEDGMRVRHDAQARFTVKSSRTTLEDRLIEIELIGGAITVASFTYNRLAGAGVSWWNPATGRPITRPKVTVRLRPEDVLTGDELCSCPVCSVDTEGDTCS